MLRASGGAVLVQARSAADMPSSLQRAQWRAALSAACDSAAGGMARK